MMAITGKSQGMMTMSVFGCVGGSRERLGVQMFSGRGIRTGMGMNLSRVINLKGMPPLMIIFEAKP